MLQTPTTPTATVTTRQQRPPTKTDTIRNLTKGIRLIRGQQKMTMLGSLLYLLVTIGRLYSALRASRMRPETTLPGANYVISYTEQVGTEADALLSISGGWKDPTGITDDVRKLLADCLIALDGVAENLEVPLIEALTDEMKPPTK